MPLTLYRYILGDLFRTLLVTTGVLVVVIAFGAAIKPLASERLLGAGQTAKYIGLAIIPMLQFALPFAAGFASTLTLHRMAADNEILAAAVGGVSYRRLLLPVAGLGLALVLIMVGLTQWLIPRFFGFMKQAVAADVTRIFEASIGQGTPIQIGDLQIYADRMLLERNPKDSEADTRLHLFGVVAAELDADRRVATDVTAHRAVVDIYRRPGETLLKLILEDTVGFNAVSGELVRTPIVKPRRAIALPMFLDDDPLTMTRGELLELRDDPDRFSWVKSARRDLAYLKTDRALREAIRERLLREGVVRLEERNPPARVITVRADDFREGEFLTEDGRPVRVEWEEAGVMVWRIESSLVALEAGASSPFGGRVIDLTMRDCLIIDAADSDPPSTDWRRSRLSIPDVFPRGITVQDYDALSSTELMNSPAYARGEDEDIDHGMDRLEGQIRFLRQEIHSRMMMRYALSTIALLALLSGAVFAMLLRQSPPLAVYLWAFVPSIIDLMMISGGEQMLRDGHPMGIYVLWGGNVVLGALCWAGYLKLARH